MRVVDGIAYADKAAEEMKLLDIKALADHELWLRFSNGETGLFDFSPLLGEAAFAALVDEEIFSDVVLEYGIPIWNSGETDISPQYLYDKARKVTAEEEMQHGYL